MARQNLSRILGDVEQDYETQIVPAALSGKTFQWLQIADLDEDILRFTRDNVLLDNLDNVSIINTA